MKFQSVDNLQAEVNFRKKLAKQHVTGEMIMPDYYNKEDHDRILLERINKTIKEIHAIGEKVCISPFIELGAERCQRSLVLSNDFNATGIAIDISFDQLRTADHFAKLFNRPKLPLRVCCDANHLPVRNNAIPFAFCYEFLHHFPSPTPILMEIYRILSEGYFFFSEEPFQRPKIVLYKQKHKCYSKVNLRKTKLIRFMESFISEPYSDEVENGIIENEKIPLHEWAKGLSVFDDTDISLNSAGLKSTLRKKIGFSNLANLMLGGEIKGLCSKHDGRNSTETNDLTELLTCPECRLQPGELNTDLQPALRRESNLLECTYCGAKYPIIDGVIILLPKYLFRNLYPGFMTT